LDILHAMLTSLRVKNLALVENVRVEFEPGLNVITGETGAGKSILIGALNLLLGDRADRKIIRTGEDTCGAEAVFAIEQPQAINALLADQGLDPCDGGQLIIRRIVKANGTSQNLVNDSPVTLQVLKALGQALVDMHGPHDHQSLLSNAFQLDLLDAYGGLQDDRAKCAAIHEEISAATARKAELQGNTQDVAAQIDVLQFRIKDIEEAAPVEGEEEQVAQEQSVISHAQRILELGTSIDRALLDGEGAAFDALVGAQKALEELARLMPDAEAWKEEARSAAVQIKELGGSVRDRLARMEADPARLAWLDERLATYRRLKKKYGASVAEVLQVLESSRRRLRDLQTREEQLVKVEAELERLRARLRKEASGLRKQREAAAEKLAKAVTRELRELGFAHGVFGVDLLEVEPGATGMDHAEFAFAPNVGESRRALRDIASSGEISRVMLACKTVLAAHDKVPVLVFDEIDANVGGETASAVGRKLASLGRHHQVLCITHLPQVAVFGASHYAVSKRVAGQRTLTEVSRLDKPSRVDEVARMLGGKDLTSVTLKHAREMIDSAKA
jgi:DNA repair protein RecN (Recombination protein N)